jgi:hypothetical protein
MQYVLLIYSKEGGWQKLSKGEQDKWMAAYHAFNEALTKSGVLKSANRLQPSSTAKTVRLADGKPQVRKGPHARAKEQLVGFYVIDVPDLDAAVSWAARCPGALHGVIEVRPSMCR